MMIKTSINTLFLNLNLIGSLILSINGVQNVPKLLLFGNWLLVSPNSHASWDSEKVFRHPVRSSPRRFYPRHLLWFVS